MHRTALHSGDIIQLPERRDGNPTFLKPSTDHWRNDPDFAMRMLHIHHITGRVDPNNPNRYKEHMTTQSNFARRYETLFTFVSPEHAADNTKAKRQELSETLVAYLNHPTSQCQYIYGMTAEVGEDLTPSDPDKYPYLSDYYTIQDTMVVLQKVLQQTPGGDPMPIGDVLQDAGAMREYYSPEALIAAELRFAGDRTHVPRGADDEEEEEKAAPTAPLYPDLKGFSFS